MPDIIIVVKRDLNFRGGNKDIHFYLLPLIL